MQWENTKNYRSIPHHYIEDWANEGICKYVGAAVVEQHRTIFPHFADRGKEL
jgi:hypothetical protein